MKVFIVFYICVSLWVPNVELNEVNLKKFLIKIQGMKNNISSKMVNVNGKIISINDFFKVDVKLLDVDNAITKENINDVSHMLNIVLSCEYLDIIFYMVNHLYIMANKCSTITVSVLNKASTNKLQNCYKNIIEYYNFYHLHIKTMVQTLLGLQSLTKPLVSNNQDIIKIMLILYAVFDQSKAEGIPQIKDKSVYSNNIKSLISMKSQIILHLERFSLFHCNSPQCEKQTETTLNLLPKITSNIIENETDGTSDFHDDYYNKRSIFVYTNFLNSYEFPFFIFCPDDSYYKIIISFIENFSDVLDSSFVQNLNQIKNDFKYIQKLIDIQTILKYERELLQMIAKIFIVIVVMKLNYIMSNQNIIAKKSECGISLQNVFDDYIQKFKDDGQPTYLIDKMILINQKVWFICYYMTSMDDTNKILIDYEINTLKGLAGMNKINYYEDVNLKLYFDGLSKQLICSKLHPAISNMYRGPLYYYDTDLFKYMVNFEYIDQRVIKIDKKKSPLCDEIIKACKIVDSITLQFDSCDKRFDKKKFENVAYHMKLLKDNLNKLQIIILLIIQNYFPKDNIDWQNMLILLRFNQSNMMIFDVSDQNSMNYQQEKQFYYFFQVIQILLNVQQHIYCNISALNKSFSKNWIKEKKKNSPHSVVPTITGEITTLYERYLNYFKNYINLIVLNDNLKEDVKFYWDGEQKTIEDFHRNLKEYTFDPLDGFKLQLFVVNWILSIVYTRLQDIVNALMPYKQTLSDSDVNKLRKCLESMYDTIPLLMDHLAKYVFKRFLTIVKDFNGVDIKEMLNIKALLDRQIEYTGIVLKTKRNCVSNSISECIESLSIKVNMLTSIYNYISHTPDDDPFYSNIDIRENLFFR